jgi:hypothetical protein
MILVRTIGATPTMSSLLVAFPGCDKQEGPMEQAGKKVARGWRTPESRSKKPVTASRKRRK